MNVLSKTVLRLRGINPDELEEVVDISREEREKMRLERERVEQEIERKARRRLFDTRKRLGGGG